MAQPTEVETSRRSSQILSERASSEASADEDELEKKHYEEVVAAFKHYRPFMMLRLHQKRKDFEALPLRHQLLLPGFQDHLSDVQLCVEHNNEIIKIIVENTDCMFVNRDDYNSPEKVNKRSKANNGVAKLDMEKVLTTVKQFVRDWSQDGVSERQACYGPIIEEIQRRFPLEECEVLNMTSLNFTDKWVCTFQRGIFAPVKSNKDSVRVLVPGAGLGRLAFEIASLGYSCQGNEFSLFMLFASHFILNRSLEVDCFTIYPWAHQFSNLSTSSQQIRPVTIPDTNPSGLRDDADFSMVAGDFLEVYTKPAVWDCVATCFFIDTAHNILAYVETIYKILKPGGFWINLGPLLYHFENTAKEPSIEIAYDVLRKVILDFSFVMLREETIHTSYLQDQFSMLKYEYDCVFFVCQKPLHANETPHHTTNDNDEQ